MPESSAMTTYYARQLVHTPNNTSTFLRGDNTFSNTLTDSLYLNSNKTINLLGSAILTLGNVNLVNLALDDEGIQAREEDGTSILNLNKLGGQVKIGPGGLVSLGNVTIQGTSATRKLTLSTDVGSISLFSGMINGNRGIEVSTEDGTSTIFYVNPDGEAYFSGSLIGNASTASAWASSRAVRVDLSSNNIANLNAGSSLLLIGVTGTLPVGSGGTGADNENGAVVNLFTELDEAENEITDEMVFIGSMEDGDTDTWQQYTASSLWEYISTKITNAEITNALIYKGGLHTLSPNNTTTFMNVPTSGYKVGWVYEVLIDGSYAGQNCRENDLIICIANGPEEGLLIRSQDWAVVHSYPRGVPFNEVVGAVNVREIERISNLEGANGLLRKDEGIWEFDDATYISTDDLEDIELPNYISKSLFSSSFQLIYSDSQNEPTTLSANITNTKKFLSMTGNGTAAQAPEWAVVSKSDVGLGNVENVALSTWAGSSNITTLGTIVTGTIPWMNISGKPSITIAGVSVSTDSGSIDRSSLLSALGLSHALRFIGIAGTSITDNSTTDPSIVGYNFGDNGSNATPGDVVLDSVAAYEYVWTIANRWERLGGDQTYKVVQNEINKPTEVINRWVSAIGQNENGDLDISYANLDTSGNWSGNAATATAWAANQTVYVNLANPSTTTVLNTDPQNAFVLGVDGVLGTANGGTGVNTHTANKLVWSISATTLQAGGNNYINNTKLAINSDTEPSYNFLVNGTVYFTASNQSISDESVIIGNANGYYITFGNNAIQTKNSSSASTLLIQPLDGTIIYGATTGSTLSAIYHGEHNFTDDNSLKYSGIQEFETNASYYLWFSLTSTSDVGIPGYSEEFSYNPYNKFLSLDGDGGIISSSGDTLTIQSGDILNINTSQSIIFNQITNSSVTEMGRFNTSRSFIIGPASNPDNITDSIFYVEGNSEFNGDITITGTLTITDSTSASSNSGAIAIEGGMQITDNLYVIGTSQLVDAVGIGGAPSNLYILYVNGDSLFNGDLIPISTNTYNIGSNALRWQDLYLANDLNINSTIILSEDGTVTMLETCPQILLNTTTTGKTNWTIQNDSGDFEITNTVEIIRGTDYGFRIDPSLYINEAVPSTNAYNFYVNGTSYFYGNTKLNGTLYFANGSTYYIDNNAEEYISDLRVDKTRLDSDMLSFYSSNNAGGSRYGYIQVTQNEMLFRKENGGTNVTPTFSFNGNILPTADHTLSLGSSTARWAKLEVGTSSTYGAYGLPVYWNSGVPLATYPIQYTTWAITNGSTSVTITKTGKYFADTYVIAIVVTGGESYLNGPLTFTSAENSIVLSTSASTSGEVTGYILTARAESI